MVGEVLKLTTTPFAVTVVYYTFTWRLEGPPFQWFQLWKRTIHKDEEFVDFVGWEEVRQGNFSANGTAANTIMFERPKYTDHKVQLMAIGENDEFSNMVDVGPLEAGPEDPPEPPKYACPYAGCTKRFYTLEELKAHIEKEHLPDGTDVEMLDKVDKIAEALTYESHITSIAPRLGTLEGNIRASVDPKDFIPYIADFPLVGKTPAEIYKKTNTDAIKANLKYAGMVSAAAIAEALPFVDVGMATLQYMSSPQWGAGNRMAGDFYYASYRYITDPMIQRHLFKLHTPLLPEPYRLAMAASQGIIGTKEYNDAMAQSGFNAEWADMWKMQNHNWLNFAQIAELYWRDKIDDPHFNMLMNLAGYYPPMISTLKELTKLIPPAQDLVTMVVREAFMPEMVTESPEVFALYMGKKGFSKEWADRYWTMHWQPIPLRQAYENYWRGNWTKEQLDFALKIADVHPMWRNDIINVAYGPPGIREMGYGYDMQVYDKEDIVRFRRWGGLSPEDAEKAARSLIEYRTSAEWEAIRREFLWRFAHEQDTEEEYRAFLEYTGCRPEIVDLWVIRGQIQQERYKVPETAIEYRIVTSSEALWAFKNDLKNEQWLRSTLENLTWTDDRIDLAVERALYEKAMKEDMPDIIQPKTLTISQLKSLYDAQLISMDALIDRLQLELHYTLEDATNLAKTYIKPSVEPEPEPEPRKLTLAILKQLYESQVITKAQLIVELVDSLNYAIEDAYAIAELYTPKFEGEPTVPEEQIVYKKPYSDAWSRRLYAQRLLMDSQVYTNYIALGYVPKQAEKLTISMLIDDVYPMITAQYMKGLIDEEGFLSVLIDIGMEAWQAIDLLERTIRDYQVDRLDDERKLTKAEIIKGYKNEVLTVSQAADLLMDIGYEYWEAQYILTLEIVIAAGDPETYWEMKKVTESYKKALNRENKPVPDEVLMLDKEIKRLKSELEELKKDDANVNKIAEKVREIADYEARLRKVLALTKLY